MVKTMIEAKNLAKRFGGRWVVGGVDLEVHKGETVALLGPNGTGKTTLMRMLGTLARPSLGTIRVNGYALPEQASQARMGLGFLGHQPMLYGDLSAEQNLSFFANLYGIEDVSQRVAEVLEIVGLHARRRDSVRIFSRGMQQRLAIGRTILHSPKVLLLDEPHTGLDHEARRSLSGLLAELAERGCSILFASHDLEQSQELADRVLVLVDGQLVASLSGKEIQGANLVKVYERFAGAKRGQ
ncbi:MAG: heme ABC exporter ATP-binding protein CcmA [Chloroflexi bacterium]|nr:heme ABC exporter ATP-binding protein CcmA [Chloroflexota bacterium]